MTYIVSPYLLESLDPATVAFLDVTGITDPTIISAVNTFALVLKANSSELWNLMDVIYLFVGGTAATHAINFKSPSIRLITFYNSPTQNASGSTFNGSSQYGDVDWKFAGTGLNDTHISVYSGTSAARPGAIIGARQAVNRRSTLFPRNNSNIFQAGIHSGVGNVVANTDGSGFFLATRSVAASIDGYVGTTKNKSCCIIIIYVII